jgi:hypothetical protein
VRLLIPHEARAQLLRAMAPEVGDPILRHPFPIGGDRVLTLLLLLGGARGAFARSDRVSDRATGQRKQP